MRHSAPPWTHDLLQALADSDLDRAVAILDGFATPHAGTAPARVKSQAIRAILTHYTGDEAQLVATGMALAASENDTAKEVGIALLALRYAAHAEVIERVLVSIGDDPNWEVREAAAMALGTMIAEHFERVVRLLSHWAADSRPNVRRMVVVGIWASARSCDDEQCADLLRVLDPLLADSDPYVRKNLGPFAIGSALLPSHPELVGDWLRGHLASQNEWVRWNIAMTFTAAAGAKHAALAKDLLTVLAADDRPTVTRAVRMAALALTRRAPEAGISLLAAWERDPIRARLATAVLAKVRS